MHYRSAIVGLVFLVAFASFAAASGSVHVKGYTRKDGTYVAPHTRSAPSGSSHSSSSGSAGSSSSHTGGSGYVHGYIRSDGTYVAPYTRGDSSGPDHSAASSRSSSAAYSGTAKRDAEGHIERSSAARSQFIRQHPCPSTGKTSGACPRYVVDHVQALKHGGRDAPDNMQWQTENAAKAKDKWE